MMIRNPFITNGYLSPHYFCDRVEETELLTRMVTNGNNVALISPRRLGKTGLIHHCFQQEGVKDHYYTFIVDIYATKNLQEFVYELGKTVLGVLKSRGRKTWEKFLNTIGSLRGNISFDINGIPEWGLGVGDIKLPEFTLDEIFTYLEQADKPCIVAIDEFQVVVDYPDKNVEAVLRTRIQRCKNAWFIYSGSQRHMMSEIFVSPSRPFYQSTSLMSIEPIDCEKYVEFAQGLFREYGKEITRDAIIAVYQRYEGVTWYMQSVLNALFTLTESGASCTEEMIEPAIQQIINQQSFAYKALLFQLPSKQKEVLMAICKEGKAANLTSRPFLQRYNLTASMVQGAVKGLLEKDFVTHDVGTYTLYDQFFAQWLLQQ
ncbi:MAG: ATP-binding protein [Prevotella sp.]|nr:ATP-binding protein [Prevotella sp.]